jgi:ribonuclease BN (tRNA processing enzyme)
MQIQFIGTGGAFDSQYGNSSALVRCNGKTFLIDCGFTIYARLKELDLFNEIDYILITHLHNDHTGSLINTLLYYNLKSNPGKKMKIIYPTNKFRKQLKGLIATAIMNTDKFVEWVPIEEMTEVHAIDTFGRHVKNYQTYGYYFKEADEVMVFSGDIGDGDFIFRQLKKQKIRDATVFHDIYFSEAKDHTPYTTLMQHMDKHRIYGYHCDPQKNPPDNTVPLVFHQAEFLFQAAVVS